MITLPEVPTAQSQTLNLTPVEDPLAASLTDDEVPTRWSDVRKVATVKTRIAVVTAIGLPVVGLIAGIIMLWGPGIQLVHLLLLLGGYMVTGLGITIGYHRFFTHKSFDTNPVIAGALAIMGSMAVEGRLIRWVGTHRIHHQHSDEDGDPHSPHENHHSGFWRGLWHAHAGWIFLEDAPEMDRYTPDLRKNKMYRVIDKLFPLWVLVSLAIPTAIAWAVTGTAMGALLGFVWGGLVRVFMVHHITWSINSVCHIWGRKTYRSHDESRNNPIFGVLGFGEGWHNNHHAFPTSARHGLEWWQFDMSYLIIRGLGMIGLAKNIKVPDESRRAAKRLA